MKIKQRGGCQNWRGLESAVLIKSFRKLVVDDEDVVNEPITTTRLITFHTKKE